MRHLYSQWKHFETKHASPRHLVCTLEIPFTHCHFIFSSFSLFSYVCNCSFVSKAMISFQIHTCFCLEYPSILYLALCYKSGVILLIIIQNFLSGSRDSLSTVSHSALGVFPLRSLMPCFWQDKALTESPCPCH